MADTNARARVLEALERYGLLLVADNDLPSITMLVVGEPIRGSWWGHEKGHEIYHILAEVTDRPDVITCKLVNGKVTLVGMPLWDPLVAAVGSAEPWQWEDTSPLARELFEAVQHAKSVRLDQVELPGAPDPDALKKAATELEESLLVHSYQDHTESGHHSRILETWDFYCAALGFERAAISSSDGRAAIEAAVRKVIPATGAKVRLPWGKLT